MQEHRYLKHFDTEYLPFRYREVNAHFYALASILNNILPDGEAKDLAILKLIEARDNAIRALS